MASGFEHRVVERLKTADGARRCPAPEVFAPQQASLVRQAPDGDDWLHEIELDGYRALISIRGGKVTVKSRNGIDWTARFPTLVHAAAKLPVAEALFDGELVRLLPDGRTSFGKLQEDLLAGMTDAVVFYAFDLLYLDGWDLTDSTLLDRKQLLESLIPMRAASPIRYAIHNIGSGPDYALLAGSMKADGIVSKQRFAPYRPGRNGTWLKTKCADRLDMIVLGFSGSSQRPGHATSLPLGYYDEVSGALTFAGRATMREGGNMPRRLSDRLQSLRQDAPPISPARIFNVEQVRWVRPEIVVETRFKGWSSTGVMKRSTVLGFREDKSAQEVVFERTDDLGGNVIRFGRKGSRP